MKAAAFDYVKPKTLSAALAAMGEEAKLLAGGQSLIASLNMRLSNPQKLIDLGAITALKGIKLVGNTLHIGAMVTHNEILNSALVREHLPLLTLAAPHIAHSAIRNRGTIGGSLALADPATEWPACCLALQATIHVESANGRRKIAAKDFFLGLYETALEEEIITHIEFPLTKGKAAFQELARRHGDYAIVGVAAFNDNFAFFGVGEKPMLVHSIEEINSFEPFEDLNGTASYKLHLAKTLFKRVTKELAA